MIYKDPRSLGSEIGNTKTRARFSFRSPARGGGRRCCATANPGLPTRLRTGRRPENRNLPLRASQSRKNTAFLLRHGWTESAMLKNRPKSHLDIAHIFSQKNPLFRAPMAGSVPECGQNAPNRLEASVALVKTTRALIPEELGEQMPIFRL